MRWGGGNFAYYTVDGLDFVVAWVDFFTSCLTIVVCMRKRMIESP